MKRWACGGIVFVAGIVLGQRIPHEWPRERLSDRPWATTTLAALPSGGPVAVDTDIEDIALVGRLSFLDGQTTVVLAHRERRTPPLFVSVDGGGSFRHGGRTYAIRDDGSGTAFRVTEVETLAFAPVPDACRYLVGDSFETKAVQLLGLLDLPDAAGGGQIVVLGATQSRQLSIFHVPPAAGDTVCWVGEEKFLFRPDPWGRRNTALMTGIEEHPKTMVVAR